MIAAARYDPGQMITVTIDSPNPGLGPQWDDLAARASSNVFMNPAALEAVRETGFASLRMLSAWDGEGAARKLVGVWALRLRRVAPLWPAVLEALPYEYAFLSSPVVDPAYADDVIAAFFAAIEQGALPKVLNLPQLDAEGAAYAAILKELGRRGIEPLVVSYLSRPYVTRESGVKRSGSTRKKLRQDWNRLSAIGTLEVVNERNVDATKVAYEQFLDLEKRSWKGAEGTAILCSERDTAFTRRLIGDLAAEGSASVALLRLDGGVIAAQVVMYCGPTAYTWKIAFDSEFAKYSPGAVLIDKLTEQLFTTTDVQAIDSCSAEGSFMAQLWTGRKTMVDAVIDVGSTRSLVFALEAARLYGYERLRDLRDWLRATSLISAKRRLAPTL